MNVHIENQWRKSINWLLCRFCQRSNKFIRKKHGKPFRLTSLIRYRKKFDVMIYKLGFFSFLFYKQHSFRDFCPVIYKQSQSISQRIETTMIFQVIALQLRFKRNSFVKPWNVLLKQTRSPNRIRGLWCLIVSYWIALI